MPVFNATEFQLPYTSPWNDLQMTWINEGMEQYLMNHMPNLGGITFSTYNTSANSCSEVITFNDTQVHSLPLLINFYDNIKLPINTSIETSIHPLGTFIYLYTLFTHFNRRANNI